MRQLRNEETAPVSVKQSHAEVQTTPMPSSQMSAVRCLRLIWGCVGQGAARRCLTVWCRRTVKSRAYRLVLSEKYISTIEKQGVGLRRFRFMLARVLSAAIRQCVDQWGAAVQEYLDDVEEDLPGGRMLGPRELVGAFDASQHHSQWEAALKHWQLMWRHAGQQTLRSCLQVWCRHMAHDSISTAHEEVLQARGHSVNIRLRLALGVVAQAARRMVWRCVADWRASAHVGREEQLMRQLRDIGLRKSASVPSSQTSAVRCLRLIWGCVGQGAARTCLTVWCRAMSQELGRHARRVYTRALYVVRNVSWKRLIRVRTQLDQHAVHTLLLKWRTAAHDCVVEVGAPGCTGHSVVLEKVWSPHRMPCIPHSHLLLAPCSQPMLDTCLMCSVTVTIAATKPHRL